MALSFAIRFSVTVDVEVMWHYLGAIDLGAELGAKICGAEIEVVDLIVDWFPKKWLTNYISKPALCNLLNIPHSSSG